MSAQSDTVVFLPAWNEEANLPGVLDELQRELPGADVLVVDGRIAAVEARSARTARREIDARGQVLITDFGLAQLEGADDRPSS